MDNLCSKCRAPAQETSASLLGLPKLEVSQSLAHLLQSNDTPLESEIPLIHDIVFNAQDRLDEFDTQIDSLQATLAQLTRRRAETAEYVHQHRALIASVRRVPQELLCEIFALAWLGEGDEETAPAPPWYLGHICRPWRDAAVSYTRLWCSVSASSENRRPLAMMKTQLMRSGNAPLRMFWRRREVSDPHSLELVVAQCHRWRTLRLDCTVVNDYRDQDEPDDEGGLSLDWLGPTADRLVQLQKLDVALNREITVPDVFTTVPALRKVVLNDWRYRRPPLLINIPWTQVTHYHGSSQIEFQLTILEAAAPLLVECVIALNSPHHSNPENVVLLPRLRRLCVRDYILLEYIKAPYLETFSSRAYQHPMRLLSFLQRSSCTLTLTKLVLRISFRSETGPDFAALFQGLPALTYLFAGDPVSRRRIHAPMFDALTTSDACPSLTSFLYGYDPTVPGEDDEHFAWDAFFAMVQSRIQPTRPCRLQCLRLVHIVQSDGAPRIDIEDRLETLRDEGLDAEFMGYSEFQGWKGRGDFL